MTRTLTALLLVAMMALTSLPALSLAEETVAFVDSCGREVMVPTEITRIAPSGGLAQMVLFALAPEMLVGVTSKWAPEDEMYIGEYYDLPVSGALYGTKGDLNLEQLAAVDPQVIIDVGEAKGSMAEDMDALQEQLGIPTVHIDASMQTFPEAFRTLGKLLGKEEEAEALAVYCEEAYASAEAVIASVGEENKAKMLYLVGEDGLNVIARGSYHSEIIDMVSDNVAVVDSPSSKGTGNPVDMEQLILWDPNYIVFAPDSVYGTVASDPLWQGMKAIQAGQYAEVPLGLYNWMGFPPSVQRHLGLLWLCDLLYPEAVSYDLREEVVEYYRLFYHCELTQEQFDSLTANASFQ